ncbi:zinc finger MYM-type protein 1-like isoform X2 [Myzus persicae]|uniref:zinc finger MYM-type protein 1-like isoform X2 n=1 Tax=Myzus persicae TaxID=13164 RepID=UPI000B9322E2|nr:zinc finger MYM-type protein 1-like isoform X2 [Myzus persicae]
MDIRLCSTSKRHLTCMAKWEAYTSTIITGSVHSQVASSHKLLVEKNVQYIKTLVDITLFLSCQRLSFIGHEESRLSLNQGHFKEICSLISKHYLEFSEKFQNTTNYTSHAVQDELANLCAENIRHKITKEIEDTKVFGIMCDEARCFRQEQMSLCVRYTVGLNIVEQFLRFIDVSHKQDAESLSAHIFAYLTKNNLDTFHVVAQSYDGANIMSGKFNGVQAKIKNKFPYAIYTHCMTHSIHLVVIDMCKYVKETTQETRTVFNTIEGIYIHFSHLTKNQMLVNMQKQLGIKSIHISCLSDTRWNCRLKNCEAILHNYKAIINVLQEETDNQTDRNANEALGILTNMSTSSFVNLKKYIFYNKYSLQHV